MLPLEQMLFVLLQYNPALIAVISHLKIVDPDLNPKHILTIQGPRASRASRRRLAT